jgi:hypothetical protein
MKVFNAAYQQPDLLDGLPDHKKFKGSKQGDLLPLQNGCTESEVQNFMLVQSPALCEEKTRPYGIKEYGLPVLKDSSNTGIDHLHYNSL